MNDQITTEEKIANAIASTLLSHALVTKDATIQDRIVYSFQVLNEFKNSIRHFSENSYAKRAIRKAEEAWRCLAHEANLANASPNREQPYIDPETCERLNPEASHLNPSSDPETPFAGCFEDIHTFTNPSMLESNVEISNYFM